MVLKFNASFSSSNGPSLYPLSRALPISGEGCDFLSRSSWEIQYINAELQKKKPLLHGIYVIFSSNITVLKWDTASTLTQSRPHRQDLLHGGAAAEFLSAKILLSLVAIDILCCSLQQGNGADWREEEQCRPHQAKQAQTRTTASQEEKRARGP